MASCTHHEGLGTRMQLEIQYQTPGRISQLKISKHDSWINAMTTRIEHYICKIDTDSDECFVSRGCFSLRIWEEVNGVLNVRIVAMSTNDYTVCLNRARNLPVSRQRMYSLSCVERQSDIHNYFMLRFYSSKGCYAQHRLA